MICDSENFTVKEEGKRYKLSNKTLDCFLMREKKYRSHLKDFNRIVKVFVDTNMSDTSYLSEKSISCTSQNISWGDL